jgi:hypothetical protein
MSAVSSSSSSQFSGDSTFKPFVCRILTRDDLINLSMWFQSFYSGVTRKYGRAVAQEFLPPRSMFPDVVKAEARRKNYIFSLDSIAQLTENTTDVNIIQQRANILRDLVKTQFNELCGGNSSAHAGVTLSASDARIPAFHVDNEVLFRDDNHVSTLTSTATFTPLQRSSSPRMRTILFSQ